MRLQRPLARRGSRQCSLQLDGAMEGPGGHGRWQRGQVDGQRAWLPRPPRDSVTSLTPGPPQHSAPGPRASRSALPCLDRSCFSLRCACEFCSFVFADLPTPSRPSAVPAQGVRWLCFCCGRCIEFVKLLLCCSTSAAPLWPSRVSKTFAGYAFFAFWPSHARSRFAHRGAR